MSEDRWRVWRADEPDGEADAQTFAEKPHRWTHRRLDCARDAAEWWAEEDDQNSAEYAIVGQRDEPVVTVEDLKTGERSHWHVEGEAVPQYRARPWEKAKASEVPTGNSIPRTLDPNAPHPGKQSTKSCT